MMQAISKLCVPSEEVKYLKSIIIVNWFGVLKQSSTKAFLSGTLQLDICYQSDLDQIQRYPNTFMLQCELSTLVSQYMYLLVICPFMLPMGIGMLRFQHACTEITHFFEARKSMEDKSDIDKILNTYSWGMSCIQTGKFTLDTSHACKKLFNMIS